MATRCPPWYAAGWSGVDEDKREAFLGRFLPSEPIEVLFYLTAPTYFSVTQSLRSFGYFDMDVCRVAYKKWEYFHKHPHFSASAEAQIMKSIYLD